MSRLFVEKSVIYFLKRLWRSIVIVSYVLGHHGDDQIETCHYVLSERLARFIPLREFQERHFQGANYSPFFMCNEEGNFQIIHS